MTSWLKFRITPAIFRILEVIPCMPLCSFKAPTSFPWKCSFSSSDASAAVCFKDRFVWPLRSRAGQPYTWLICQLIYKGGPHSVSKNHISFRCKKRTQKLASCTFLSWSWQPFPFYYVDARGRVFPKPAIEAFRGSARPGRGQVRPGQGHASDAKRIGTRTKRDSWGLETI